MTITDPAPPRTAAGRPRDDRIDRDVLAITAAQCAHITYSRLSLSDIARRAGTTRAAISRRWTSKAELVIDAFLHHTAEITSPDTGSLRGDLRALTHQNAELFAAPAHRGLTVATLGALADLGLAHTGIPQPRSASIVEIFDRARARGDHPSHADPVTITQLLAGAVLYRSVILDQALDHATIAALVDGVLGPE